MRAGTTRKVLLVFASAALTLSLAEVTLRLVWTPPSLRSTRAFGPHPYYRVAPLPCIRGIHATSEYEIRFRHTCQRLRGNAIFAHERPAGVARRFLILGDSFAYGVGVNDDETFAARLARMWPTVEVANTGCNGYGTRDELAVLDQFGAAFRPDLTLLLFFWNDLENNLERSSPDFEIDGEGRIVRTDVTPPGGSFDPLAIWPTAPIESRAKRAFYLGRLFKEGMKGLRYRVLGISPRFIRTAEQKEQAWRITAKLLSLTAHRTHDIGSKLLVASIPSHNRVDPHAVIKNIEPLHYVIEQRLATECAKLGIPYTNLLPALESAFHGGVKDLYYYADRHLTPKGHSVVAHTLAPQVAAMLGIPPPS